MYVFHSGNNAFAEWEANNRITGPGWRIVDFGYAVAIEGDGRIVRVSVGEGEKTSHDPQFDAWAFKRYCSGRWNGWVGEK